MRGERGPACRGRRTRRDGREGVSDLLYLSTMSGLLASQQRTALSDAWTTTPVGGSDKVTTFVSLLGSQKKMKVATLIEVDPILWTGFRHS